MLTAKDKIKRQLLMRWAGILTLMMAGVIVNLHKLWFENNPPFAFALIVLMLPSAMCYYIVLLEFIKRCFIPNVWIPLLLALLLVPKWSFLLIIISPLIYMFYLTYQYGMLNYRE